ncbi:MAG: nucleoside triphosphate pyrophosphohydrolase [Porticoccaceae bacterium]|jgi:ATP diphosphatase|nr:nucleoside triphosphate pyrophosphohydrolase [Porticoccaceae bacterium]MDG1311925.1 nucleoside triphosphate pyrophosphohydrolase [Porticoccaceae bacterium]
MSAEYSIADLRYLMSRLRDPQTGCPWDIKQTYKTITPHTVEEAYEVVDAIERGDIHHLSEELGDLLFQIIFYSQLGEEDNQFNFDAVVSQITGKLLRRHPHVFPDGTLQSVRDSDSVASEAEIKKNWETIKQQERSEVGTGGTLDDIPLALPALSRAFKLQKRAANTGFDWSNISDVVDKVKEEIAELEVEIAKGDSQAMEEELGDLLFSCVNLARHLAIDPEKALALASDKFKRRFQAMEAAVGQGRFADLSLDEMELQWIQAKGLESL